MSTLPLITDLLHTSLKESPKKISTVFKISPLSVILFAAGYILLQGIAKQAVNLGMGASLFGVILITFAVYLYATILLLRCMFDVSTQESPQPKPNKGLTWSATESRLLIWVITYGFALIGAGLPGILMTVIIQNLFALSGLVVVALSVLSIGFGVILFSSRTYFSNYLAYEGYDNPIRNSWKSSKGFGFFFVNILMLLFFYFIVASLTLNFIPFENIPLIGFPIKAGLETALELIFISVGTQTSVQMARIIEKKHEKVIDKS